MNILTRYVTFDLLKVFLVSLTGMTAFMLLVGVFKEAYLQGLGLKQVLLLIPFILPEALRFAVPATILFAVCSVFGRLASSNEVIAVKASGISPLVLLWPAFVLAFLLSLAAVWLNDVAVSWGREGVTRVVIESVEEIAYGRLKQQRSYSTRQFAINVRDVEGKKMIRPTFTFQGSGDSAPVTVSCEEAQMRTDLKANTLTIECRNGIIEIGDFSAVFPDTIERVIALDEASRKGSGTRSPSDLPMADIPGEKTEQRERIAKLQQQMAAKAALEMITGDFAALASGEWDGERRKLTDAQVRLNRLTMEPYRRWANGFSCLCFVIVGAPLAIVMRNSDFLTSFFACFLPILLVYYPLLFFGVTQAKSGTFPPYSVWAGNIILMAAGVWLIRRVCRY